MALGRTTFELGFQVSPIILTNGIAALIPGNMLPIIALTEAASFVTDLLNGNVDSSLDNFFAHYRPMPGSNLVSQQLGQYPFANQTVAANAVISNPLRVSMLMHCPMRKAGAAGTKLLTMTALKKVLDTHNSTGGTYTVATPSYVFTNCIMLDFRDASQGYSKQAQTDWQLDFEQPLITLSEAEQVFNSLMGKIAGGLPMVGQPTWSGLASNIGSAISGVASSVVGSAQNLVGSAVSGVQNTVSSLL